MVVSKLKRVLVRRLIRSVLPDENHLQLPVIPHFSEKEPAGKGGRWIRGRPLLHADNAMVVEFFEYAPLKTGIRREALFCPFQKAPERLFFRGPSDVGIGKAATSDETASNLSACIDASIKNYKIQL